MGPSGSVGYGPTPAPNSPKVASRVLPSPPSHRRAHTESSNRKLDAFAADVAARRAAAANAVERFLASSTFSAENVFSECFPTAPFATSSTIEASARSTSRSSSRAACAASASLQNRRHDDTARSVGLNRSSATETDGRLFWFWSDADSSREPYEPYDAPIVSGSAGSASNRLADPLWIRSGYSGYSGYSAKTVPEDAAAPSDPNDPNDPNDPSSASTGTFRGVASLATTHGSHSALSAPTPAVPTAAEVSPASTPQAVSNPSRNAGVPILLESLSESRAVPGRGVASALRTLKRPHSFSNTASSIDADARPASDAAAS